MDKQNDLFLLMFSLSQLENTTQIIKLFHESLNELFKPLKFFFSEDNPNKAPYCIKITANDITYGYLFSDEIPDNEIVVSIQNALQVLTVILEKLKTEEELKGRARSYESIAQKRLDAIKASVAELEDSRKESLNLIEDLKSEIAEREKIEKALRESEEKYHALFFNNRTVMILLDSENGKILEANPAASSFYGWTLDEMKKMSLFDINTSAKKEILQNISKAKQKEQNYFHFIHRLKDGTQKEVDTYSWPISIKEKGYLFSIIHDTTQQIIAERKLEENERLFRSIVENSFEGIGLIDNNFTFTYVNENLAKLLNYPVEEIVGSTFIQFFAPENREIVTDRHIRRKRGEQVPSRYEVLLLRKDGEKVVTEISASTFKDSDGNPLILVQFIDITEKKKTEEKLRLQRYHQQIILDASPTAIWFKDKKNNIIRANKAATAIAKKSIEEIEGKPSKEIFPEDAEKYYQDDLEVINSGKPKTGIVEPIKAGNKISWLRTDKLPWYDEEGNIAGVVVYSEDITEIRGAEETVKKERDQAQRYLDIAGVMFASLNSKGEIIIVNKKGCEILGYDNADELVGKNWLDTCLPESNKQEIKDIFREQMAGNIKAFEYYENPVVTKSGEERLIAFHNTVLLDQKGNISGVLFSGEDITERVKAEEQIKKLNAELEIRVIERTAELEKANKNLEEINDIFVGREMRIIELKEEVDRLKKKLLEK
ncbi:MAG: PAS domain S-box protein [Bacteroidales bacterium]|nr:PAS domain S-box protein [Bacteroidales bacterium]